MCVCVCACVRACMCMHVCVLTFAAVKLHIGVTKERFIAAYRYTSASIDIMNSLAVPVFHILTYLKMCVKAAYKVPIPHKLILWQSNISVKGFRSK